MDFADTSPVALVLSLVIGYLSGSVPYGLLLTQMAGLGDVRCGHETAGRVVAQVHTLPRTRHVHVHVM